MKAALQTGIRRFELTDVARPQAGPGEALARVQAAGICGSDLHDYIGRAGPQARPGGHEVSGVIEEVGEGVEHLRPGDRVAIEILGLARACGTCRYCQGGSPIHCQGERLPFVGGFAEYVVGRAPGFFRLPAEVDERLGALVEPLAVGVHAIRWMGVERTAHVVILGAGTIGLCALMAARSLGCERVYISAKHAFQAATARRLGAAAVLPVDPEGAQDAVEELTDGSGADVVLEAVGGSGDTLDLASRLVRRQGRVGVLGLFTEGRVSVDLLRPLFKELRIDFPVCYGTMDGRHDFQVAIDVLARQPALAASLITHQFTLDEIGAAFATAADKGSGAIKVQVRP